LQIIVNVNKCCIQPK